MYQHTGKAPKITVLLDSTNEGVKKQFHCPVCGFVAFEYFGELRGLVPGAQIIEKTGARVVISCRGKNKKFKVDGSGELVAVMKKTLTGETVPDTIPCKALFYV